MTPPGLPTSRSWPTRRPRRRSASCAGPSPSTPAHGIAVERLMTDNGSAYVSIAHAIACRALGIRHIRTRPYRPRTNGKAERFIRTHARRLGLRRDLPRLRASAPRRYPAGWTSITGADRTAPSPQAARGSPCRAEQRGWYLHLAASPVEGAHPHGWAPFFRVVSRARLRLDRKSRDEGAHFSPLWTSRTRQVHAPRRRSEAAAGALRTGGNSSHARQRR